MKRTGLAFALVLAITLLVIDGVALLSRASAGAGVRHRNWEYSADWSVLVFEEAI